MIKLSTMSTGSNDLNCATLLRNWAEWIYSNGFRPCQVFWVEQWISSLCILPLETWENWCSKWCILNKLSSQSNAQILYKVFINNAQSHSPTDSHSLTHSYTVHIFLLNYISCFSFYSHMELTSCWSGCQNSYPPDWTNMIYISIQSRQQFEESLKHKACKISTTFFVSFFKSKN